MFVFGADNLTFDKNNYLHVQIYYSGFLEILNPRLYNQNKNTNGFIFLFWIFNCPRCDNSAQLCSEGINSFAKSIKLSLVVSSTLILLDLQSQLRKLLRKEWKLQNVKTTFLLLSYKSAPLENRYALAELLMERRVKSTVSVTIEQLYTDFALSQRSSRNRKKIKNGNEEGFL